jgi:YVTN family beta-propeller protein
MPRRLGHSLVVAAQHLHATLETTGVDASKPYEGRVMPDNRSNRSFSERRFAAPLLAVCLIAAFGVRQARAAPFVYMPGFSAVTVIDTATNALVASVTVPFAYTTAAAMTPDGNRVYVAGLTSPSGDTALVCVIDTATNMVVATIPVPPEAQAQNGLEVSLAITPDGKTVYETGGDFGPIAVIDTATNTVVATIPTGGGGALAVAPDGKRLYLGSGNVIDTATNTVVATIPFEQGPFAPDSLIVTPNGKRLYVGMDTRGVDVYDTSANILVARVPAEAVGLAVTPDGRYVYAGGPAGGAVSVIDTGTNTVVKVIPQDSPGAIGIIPDGKRAYVGILGFFYNGISVIDTATNTVVATIQQSPIFQVAFAAAAMPLPPGLAFASISAKLEIGLQNSFELQSEFTLGQESDGIDPSTQWVTLRVGTFGATIPAGSFKKDDLGQYIFDGEIDGAALHLSIRPTGTLSYAVEAAVNHADVVGTENPVIVTLTIGDDGGTTTIRSAEKTNTHDFNGDGYSDIAWRDTSGNAAVWLMNGSQLLQGGEIGSAPTSWSIVGQRDFNGDGKADLLWSDADGRVAIWFMNGSQVSQQAYAPSAPGWTAIGTGDFNGDGMGDILWQDSTRNLAIWLMSGAEIVQSGGIGKLPGGWTVAGIGDFDGDSKSDILFHSSTGAVAIWFMNGLQVAQHGSAPSAQTVWSIIGTGDFNGDGHADILWRNRANDMAVWLMQGASILQSGGIGSVSSSWTVAETGDFDGDGKSDILWRDTSGNIAMWYMNGTAVSQHVAAGSTSLVWTIQGAHAD